MRSKESLNAPPRATSKSKGRKLASDWLYDNHARNLRHFFSVQGEAQREIVRVAMDCCLQEAAWNPYYAALLRNVLAASQNHCVTAQFCIWDHLKDVQRQDDRRIKNLALLTAQLIVDKALPLASLRVGCYLVQASHNVPSTHVFLYLLIDFVC